jgi:hypothetical protein
VVTFQLDYQERQSRLTTFFRFLTVIPPAIWWSIWSLALIVTLPVAWVALLITARYPAGLYDFHVKYARYGTFVEAYSYLATDRWPGFSGAPEVDYPAQLVIGPPLEEYSRWKVALRIFLLIPVWIIAYAVTLVVQIGAFVAWFVIVITGRLPDGLFELLEFALSYLARALPYALLLSEDFPPIVVRDDSAAPA